MTLPPFAAMRGFEAAARHLSFRKAAEELCLTQSAISHRVRQLEEFIGTPLFVRSPQGVALTPAGRRYLDGVAPAFAALSRATEGVMGASAPEVLTIRCAPTFGGRWLMPRLAEAEAAMSPVPIGVTTSHAPEADEDPTDVRIFCGYFVPPDQGTEVFMHSRRAPVCSAAFLAAHGPVRTPEDLLRLPLIRDRMRDEWDEWFEGATGRAAAIPRALWFDDGYVAIDAAEAGAGVVLGHLTLIDRELREGTLVRLFEEATPERLIFTVMSPPGWRDVPRIARFRRWLKAALDEDARPDRLAAE